MNHVVDASQLAVTWWKSSASGAQSDCVECAVVSSALVAVRDSKVPAGPALLFEPGTLTGLVAGIKSGAL